MGRGSSIPPEEAVPKPPVLPEPVVVPELPWAVLLVLSFPELSEEPQAIKAVAKLAEAQSQPNKLIF